MRRRIFHGHGRSSLSKSTETRFTWHKGEDARKEAAWRGEGWRVERIPSEDVCERPHALLVVAP